jgi:threonine dehydrogenase-like Zn-dependent dehydrogenase
MPGTASVEPLAADGRVHVVGAGPVGLLLTALHQSMDGFSVSLYENDGSTRVA